MTYNNLCIEEETSIKEAIKILDDTGKQILLVVKEKKLKGVITDGDIRRWILKNGELNKSVKEIMTPNPVSINYRNIEKAKNIMKSKKINAIPLIDEENEIKGIVFWNDEFSEEYNTESKIANPVVIMAGGKGTRLYPYTKILPKPLIPIGDIPIVERIINRFNSYGCDMFYLTVNYKKNMIKAYFNELEKGYKMNYVEEPKPLGTGGSLYLLKDKLNETFFVSNCDILIDADYSKILKYHREQNNEITIVTALKNYIIPYGVVKLSNSGEIKDTEEKPEYSFLVNTGMYVLEPQTLKDIPKDEFFHITELIDKYLKEGKKVGTYPVTDNAWLDMGEFKEMERMIERLGL